VRIIGKVEAKWKSRAKNSRQAASHPRHHARRPESLVGSQSLRRLELEKRRKSASSQRQARREAEIAVFEKDWAKPTGKRTRRGEEAEKAEKAEKRRHDARAIAAAS